MNTQICVLDAIAGRPGIHFRELLRTTGLTNGQLQHHIHVLIKKNMITTYKLFRFSCYCTSATPPEDRTLLALIQHPVCREIIAHLLHHDGAHCHELGHHTDLSASTISWYVSRLKKEGVLADELHGKHKCLRLNNAKKAEEIMSRKQTALQKTTSNFIDTWKPN